MNELTIRRQILTSAAALLRGDRAPSTGELLLHAGRVYRLSCTDADASEEAAALVAEADALLDPLAQAARGRDLDAVLLPDLAPAREWLASPRSHHAATLALLDHLGALQAALSLIAPESPTYRRASEASDALVQDLQIAAVRAPEATLDLAVAALEQMTSAGVVPGEDRALLALDALAQRNIAAALRGQPLPAPRAIRVRPIAAEQAEALGKALALAMQRSQPLQVAPDLLQLADFPAPPAGSRRFFDLTLHNAQPGAPLRESIELMRDVRVTVTDEEIEVELQDAPQGAVLLVPLRSGDPGDPCPQRSGNHPNHLVFTPPSPEEDLEGYALVVGDRLAFLRR